MKKLGLLLLIVTVILFGCSNNKNCMVLNIDKIYEDCVNLDINQYVNNPRNIVLQIDSVVFRQNEKIYPGKKYIVLAGYDKIFLFPDFVTFSTS